MADANANNDQNFLFDMESREQNGDGLKSSPKVRRKRSGQDEELSRRVVNEMLNDVIEMFGAHLGDLESKVDLLYEQFVAKSFVNPIARRYGFHRSTLKRLCERLEIEYVHFPTLGIASEKRQQLDTAADYRKLFVEYGRNTLREQTDAIRDVSALVAERPSVLVCMENDPAFCHRSVLAAEVAKCSGLPIHNLGCCHERRED